MPYEGNILVYPICTVFLTAIVSHSSVSDRRGINTVSKIVMKGRK